MTHSILIIDDDLSVRKMLSQLIHNHQLGRVLEELSEGTQAVDEILFYRPDIVIVDMLLPGKDGIHIIREAISEGYKGKFVMVSQVVDPEIVGKAYESGVVFYLNKPVNQQETVSILKQVSKTIDMEKSIDLIRSTISVMPVKEAPSEPVHKNIQGRIQDIFSDIGIVNESGSQDLRNVLLKVLRHKQSMTHNPYTLQDIYREVLAEKSASGREVVNLRSFEQRIRRLVLKALNTVAVMGAEDYYNLKFMDYSTILFDLKEVKNEIDYIQGTSVHRGKINIKKFIEGFCAKLTT